MQVARQQEELNKLLVFFSKAIYDIVETLLDWRRSAVSFNELKQRVATSKLIAPSRLYIYRDIFNHCLGIFFIQRGNVDYFNVFPQKISAWSR